MIEHISLIGLRLAGCSWRKTYWINRAPERINELLYSEFRRLLPPIRLLYGFVSLSLTMTIKYAFLLCHTKGCVNVVLLINLNMPRMWFCFITHFQVFVKWRKGPDDPWCHVNWLVWICWVMFFHLPATDLYNSNVMVCGLFPFWYWLWNISVVVATNINNFLNISHFIITNNLLLEIFCRLNDSDSLSWWVETLILVIT